MADVQNNNETTVAPSPEEILVKLHDTMAPKEEVEKWQNKYNELFAKVANGQLFESEEPKKSEGELKEEFEGIIAGFDKHKFRTSLESAQNLLKFDDYLTSHGQRSAFLPSKGEPDPETIESANRVRSTLQNAVDQAQGSSEVFSAVLGNSLRDAT